jgi:hypothetical protein
MSRSYNIGEYVDEEISIFKDLQNTQKNNLDILKTEKDRMLSKEKNIDTKISNAKRILLLSESYRDRQRMYTLISLVVVFMAILVFLIQKLMPNSMFKNLFILAILLIGIFYIVNLGVTINKRDKIDFSKLSDDSTSMFIDDPKNSGGGGSLNKGGTVCVGEDCCGPGFVYNGKVCVLSAA